jgi:hypothetical protein
MLSFVLLSACASMHETPTNASFQKFQNEIISQRSEGKLTAAQAQLDLWSKYREMYGEDPVMNGFYAYSVKIMSAVDAGKMTLDEGQALVDARQQEIATRKVAEAERRLAYDPNGSPSD